jgi:hypothetical protein
LGLEENSAEKLKTVNSEMQAKYHEMENLAHSNQEEILRCTELISAKESEIKVLENSFIFAQAVISGKDDTFERLNEQFIESNDCMVTYETIMTNQRVFLSYLLNVIIISD